MPSLVTDQLLVAEVPVLDSSPVCPDVAASGLESTATAVDSKPEAATSGQTGGEHTATAVSSVLVTEDSVVPVPSTSQSVSPAFIIPQEFRRYPKV